MTIELLVLMFLKAQAAAGGAAVLVLALRLPVRRLLGAELGYGLWALVPTASLASLFPSLPEFRQRLDMVPDGLALQTIQLPVIAHARALGLAWLAGAALVAAMFAAGHRRFTLEARAGVAGPAITGFWPHMVVPSDYAERFSAEERAFIRAHERAHMTRQDLGASLLIAVFQVAGWFNPLTHLAAAAARLDQELACDASVIAQHPRARRRYAETLLKAHARGWASPLACALALGGKHPLEVRLAMLGVRKISVRRDQWGVFAIGLLAVGIAAGLWGLSPVWWEMLGGEVLRARLPG